MLCRSVKTNYLINALKDCQRLKEADQTCMAVVRSVAVEV
jgi:hypothetical protein